MGMQGVSGYHSIMGTQAKMMSYLDDRSIVTCAVDGHVTQIPNLQIHTWKGSHFLKNEDKGIDQERLPYIAEK